MTRKIAKLMCFVLLTVSCANLQEEAVSFQFTSDGKPLKFDSIGMFAELEVSVDLLEFFKDKDPALKVDFKDIKKSIEENIIKKFPVKYQGQLLERLSKRSTCLGEKLSRKDVEKFAYYDIDAKKLVYFIELGKIKEDQDLQQDEQGRCYVNVPKLPATEHHIYYNAQVSGFKGPIRVYVGFNEDIVKRGKNIPIEIPKLDASITAKIVNISDAPVPLVSLVKYLTEEEGLQIALQIPLCVGWENQEENVSLSQIPSAGEVEFVLRKKGVGRVVPPTWFVDVPMQERGLMLEEELRGEQDIIKKFQINPGKNDLGEIKLFQLVYPFKLQIKLKEDEKEEILFEGSERFSDGRYFKFEFYNPEMDWTFVTGQLSGHLPKKGEYILKIGVEVDKIKTEDDRVLKIKPVEKEVKIKIESKEENTFTIYFEPEE